MIRSRIQKPVLLATLGVFAAAVAGMASCAPSLPGTARDAFAVGLGCPPDNVSVVPEGEYQTPMVPAQAPPADVAADPDRLAYWRSTHGPAQGEHAPNVCGNLFEVTGCGHRATYCCAIAQTERSGANGRVYAANSADCTLVSKDGTPSPLATAYVPYGLPPGGSDSNGPR